MMIWNRKEVFVGNSSERFAEVRNILSFNKIKHAYKIVDRTSPGFLAYLAEQERVLMG